MLVRRGVASWFAPVLGLVGLATLALPAGAQAAAITGTVAMYSDTADYIGQGHQAVYSSPSDSFAISGTAASLTVTVNGAGGDHWTMEFAAGGGHLLTPGVYDPAHRVISQGSGPGIDIFGNGRGCDADLARFEVKDIATDSSGVPDRLWIVFEQHCEAAVPALFGEIRLGEPAGTTAPAVVRWPARDFGTPETVVLVRLQPPHPTRFGAARITGTNPSSFQVRSDGCNGQTASSGAPCVDYVRFIPTSPGLKTAVLQVADASGTLHEVPLQGWTYGGTTRLTMTSDPGDYIGQGQSYSFSPANAIIGASGSPQTLDFFVDIGEEWRGDFAPGQGDIFTAGKTYTGAQRYAFRGSSPGLEVDSPGSGCNTVTGQFTVKTVTYDAGGTVKTFAVQFVQHCEGAQPALHGEFDWRAGDTTPPAPWMAGGSSGALLRTRLTQLLGVLRRAQVATDRAMLRLLKHPGRRTRAAAIRALAGLQMAAGGARRDLIAARPLTSSGKLERARAAAERAVAAWRSAVAREQQALHAGSGPSLRRIWSPGVLAARRAAAASRALEVLTTLA